MGLKIRFTLWLALLAITLHDGGAIAAGKSPASELRAQYSALDNALAHNQFNRPLYLNSTESAGNLKGDIYTLIDYPFASVSAALNNPASGPDNWCDVLMLHPNTKYCRAAVAPTGTVLAMRIGRKFDQPLEDAYEVNFDYRVKAATSDYFAVELTADNGPLGTRDYRILLEAVSTEHNQTFMHLTYAYAYGFAGRVALKSYLATAGSNKVGFTINGRQGNSQPIYMTGVRGLVERNTMRYYLAIDAYLSTLATPSASRAEKRLATFFAATEQYPRQLHELERGEYLSMKRKEYQRLSAQ
jgi:hypothetical protein